MKLKKAFFPLFQRKTKHGGDRKAGNSGGPTRWLCFDRDSVSLPIFPTRVFIPFDFPLPNSIRKSIVLHEERRGRQERQVGSTCLFPSLLDPRRKAALPMGHWQDPDGRSEPRSRQNQAASPLQSWEPRVSE